MAAKYGMVMEGPAGPATEEIGDVSCTTTLPRRLHIYDFLLSSTGTPADTQFDWIIQRTTAHGTRGTAVVPKPLDFADGPALADAGEGTYTIAVTNTSAEELFEIGLNLRATFRWVAAPDGEVVVPATDNAGLVWICNHASATDEMRVTAHFLE